MTDRTNEETPSIRFDFRPGQPDLSQFPRRIWARSARRVFGELRVEQLAYGDPCGSLDLRRALTDYLARVRGVVSPATQMVIATGFAQGLSLIARTLARDGVTRIAVEDPSHPDQRRIVADAGIGITGVVVDQHGLNVDVLERTRAQAVLVTPAHQFPTGSVLSADRRQRLIAWARSRAAWIIEDDYDAEYRYDRTAIGAIQGLAPDRVIYAGSASKILAPALRLGWCIFPKELVAVATDFKRRADLGSPVLGQLIFAEFLASGELDRHLRRTRGIYSLRRDVVVQELGRYCPTWTVEGVAAGLHIVAELPRGQNAAAIARRAERHSVRVNPMSAYQMSRRPPEALVLGYAGMTHRQIAEGIRNLATRG
jgi:GntR family transcriptional regulator/MocR family aminotransferase